ncbi:hypothetical protein AB0N07_46460 [Streptomyces sp. NPDC051172]|uniref:hypothetical protein n=1 Tax=Streptomyces sp. NPDC051172 TaxID=3155796 RepID=UPI0034271CE4
MVNLARSAVPFGLAASLTRVGVAGLSAKPPGGRGRWERKHHAGRSVELYVGPAVAAAAAVGAGRVRPAAGFAVLAAGACGAYDDIAGADGHRRGFRDQLSALRDGEVTGGAVMGRGSGAPFSLVRVTNPTAPQPPCGTRVTFSLPEHPYILASLA